VPGSKSLDLFNPLTCFVQAFSHYLVSERYIAKSNPYIVMVSTPNAPDGLFERIEKNQKIHVFTKGYFWIMLMVLVRYTLQKK
jgi:hypothetical protein